MAADWFVSRPSRSFRERAAAWALLAAFAACAATLPAQAQTPSAVTYTVTFAGNWAVAPDGGLAQGVSVVGSAHFTTLAGAVHNSNVTFWTSGGKATAGVTAVAELGATSTFASEVNKKGSDVAVYVSQSPGGGGTPTRSFDVEFTSDHPLFTLLSMIGPSPDWFVGVSGLSMLDDQNQWVARREVDLFAYDAGTRDNNVFRLGGPQTSPQGNITSLRNVHPFSDQPMARLILFRASPPPANAAPAFSGSTSFSVQENDAAAGTVRATDSDAGDSVTGYAIESGLDGALFSITSAGALSFRAAPNYEDPQDADKDNVYSVEIRATSGTGARAMSATETFSVTVTDADEEAPSAPAAPSVTAVSVSMLRVSWTAPSNEGPDIDDYDYRYRRQGSATWTEETNTTIAGLSVTIDGLSPNTAYEAQVLAKNAEGSSDWSSSGVGATPVMALGQVTGVSVAAQPGRLLVSWNAVTGATGYHVQWKGPGEEYDESARQARVGAVTEHTISNLTPGVEYTVRVMAIGAEMAEGLPSEEAQGAPLTVFTTAFASASSSADEAAGVVNVAVRIDPAPPGDVEISYGISGTATYGADYSISGATNSSGVVVVSEGATGANIPVAIVNDELTEEDETVVLTLTNALGDGLGAHVLTIEDDDTPAFLAFFSSAASVASEAAGVVDVAVRLDPAPPEDVEISYGISGTATYGADYAISGATSGSGTLSAASGSSSATISVAITNDDADEGDETVILTFQEGEGYGLGSERVHTLIIEDDDGEPTSAESADREIPAAFALRQNYPNPFNPETTIRYELPRAGEVRLAVYNSLGHEVALLVDRSQPAGHYSIRFGAGHLPSGLYLYRLRAGGENLMRTMLLVK